MKSRLAEILLANSFRSDDGLPLQLANNCPTAIFRTAPGSSGVGGKPHSCRGPLMYIGRARTALIPLVGRHAMVSDTRCSNRLWISLAAVLCLAFVAAGQVGPDLFSGLQWRNVGPYHGGRIASVTGVIGEPGTFYVGLPQGGIWKTTSGGMTWYPVFDQVTEVDSIGAIQVAPSDRNIIYAGSGDAVSNAATGTNGDGMYKSTDAGKTWTHIGLEGTTRIPKIVVDPKDPNIVIVAAMAGTTGTQRGIFRTDDGGQTWTNTLHPDNETGARDLSSASDMPNVIFTTTISEAPAAPFGGGGGAAAAAGVPSRTKLYKSLDEGKTWTEVTSNPSNVGRIGVAVAMHTNGQRIFVVGAGQQNGSGLFRSDDQ